MTDRPVVTRTRRSETGSLKEFGFTKEMLPLLKLNGRVPEVIKNYGKHAWDTFTLLPMPSVSDESWRRTDIRGLQVNNFTFPTEEESQKLTLPPKEYLEPLIGDHQSGQIILSPTKNEQWLDAVLVEKGVIFTDILSATSRHSDRLSSILGKIVKPDEGKFAALASAFTGQGVFLYVPKNVHIEFPLHSFLWGPGNNLAYFSHLMVYVDDGASLTYVHESASPDEANAQTLHAGIVEIYVGEEAKLRFVELQSWGSHVWNFCHERARVERDGNIDWIFGAIGSHLTKNFTDLDLVGKGAIGKMSGFYFTDGSQHLDHDTQQNHLAPNTTSDLLFKGALKDSSRSVWQGMIYVAPGAQKTDGYQANRNLILSKKARADSIPGLEILADDVRCTHGATVGKIDADQTFYLNARGIPTPEAERLIVEGFFDPIMQRIPFEGVRNRFQQAILKKMDH